MPYAENDESHEGYGTVFPEYIDQDLDDGLANVRIDGFGKILDGEKEGDHEKKAKNCGNSNGHKDAEGSIPRRVVCFFGQMG